MYTDIYTENVMLLIAATAKIAINDAKRGDSEAKEWLCEMVPEWTRYALPPKRKHAAHRKAGAGGVSKKVSKML